ncbi:gag-asp_proteas domain-containing protein [Cucumis melo var. makuwa]|uniref:Gag-asp_proteas domain-containing protein n=1 Tax=Cucumis melo var. makuwa TaxID=1194695 RepID=A0A5D3CK66_CUCMM|nr:gag-asp_proteas domain-containing protein [Cucumis melo var. makuwa]
MDDFDVVLEMEFLLEHQVIPMPSAKCLVITGSFSTIMQADIRQPNGFKVISAMQLDKSPVQEEPYSWRSCLGRWKKLGETVPKYTLCVLEKCHSVMPNSWPKSLSMRRMTDHGIELPPEAKAPAKNANRTTPPKLASDIRPRYYRVRVVEAEGLETTCITGFRAYEFPMVPFSLIDAKGGKCVLCREINVLCHVVEFHQIEMGKRKIAATCDERKPKSVIELRSCLSCWKKNTFNWGENLECQAAFDGLKQAMFEGQRLRVANATKPSKTRELGSVAECSPVRSPPQTDSLIRRIQFEIKGNRHSVLPPFTDGPYVEDDPQVHRVEEE